MPKAPRVCGLTFCEKMAVNTTTRRVSLEGLFLVREYETFPALAGSFTIYAALFDGRGEGELKVSCTHLESEQEVHYHKKWYGFPGKGKTIHLEMILRKLEFPKPGRYGFDLTFDKKLLTTRYLDVWKKSHES